MHGRPLLLATAAAALAVAAVPATAGAEQVTITKRNSGHTVTVRTGDRIRVVLAANETTGYRWSITARPDRSVVRLLSEAYVEPEGGAIGQGGRQRYLLRAVAPGRTGFSARYAQVGSGDVGSTFTIRIRVRPKLS
jgi:predicted secreted protein